MACPLLCPFPSLLVVTWLLWPLAQAVAPGPSVSARQSPRWQKDMCRPGDTELAPSSGSGTCWHLWPSPRQGAGAWPHCSRTCVPVRPAEAAAGPRTSHALITGSAGRGFSHYMAVAPLLALVSAPGSWHLGPMCKFPVVFTENSRKEQGRRHLLT